ncbi:CBS domain-containing protein [Nocardioides zeae]|uniref:CBS domain-containing protein n=1 Tax=Nocardioides imazamoxiresistens TaxID=3231893 RepID=A0ABU3PRC9_9ACTN|nr:CBS domain-containing protein [Nocardioides zeae]MDT9591441.1 CBS domain-containing protein [Nocardioides zeae]
MSAPVAVREVMTVGAECAQVNETLASVASRMRDLGIGAMPLCGEDGLLVGMVTDRDIVVRCVAAGCDPDGVTVRQFAGARPVTVEAGASLEEAVDAMVAAGVRRLPVVEEHELVGMLSLADVVGHLPAERTAEVLRAICDRPPG